MAGVSVHKADAGGPRMHGVSVAWVVMNHSLTETVGAPLVNMLNV